MRTVGLLLALLSLLHVLPPTDAALALALTVCVAAIAFAVTGRTGFTWPVLVRLRTAAVDAPVGPTRQYEPASAGRPQPRAPGCGR